MYKLKKLLAGMLIFAIPAISAACSDDDDSKKSDDSPQATIENVTPTETSVSFSVRSKNADSFEWSVYTTDGEAQMTKVEKTGDDINREGLETGKSYTIEVVAYKGATASPSVRKKFTTTTGGGPGNATGYVKNILVHKYTATDCGYCPNMTAALKKAQEDLPDDKLIIMAMHCTLNEGISQFVTPEATDMYNNIGGGLPTAWIDEFMKAASSSTEIKALVKQSKKVNPGIVGIDFESKSEGTSIKVKGRLSFVEGGKYKICCALLEDGIVYKHQYSVGGEGDDLSLYNHVLRDYAEETPVSGLSLDSIAAESTKDFEYTITTSSDWKIEKCSVVVYVLKEYKTGDYNISNANTAKVGAKAVSVPISE